MKHVQSSLHLLGFNWRWFSQDHELISSTTCWSELGHDGGMMSETRASFQTFSIQFGPYNAFVVIGDVLWGHANTSMMGLIVPI